MKEYFHVKLLCFSAGTCCSRRGWCSHSPDECLCDECTYYEWEDGEYITSTYYECHEAQASKMVACKKEIYQMVIFWGEVLDIVSKIVFTVTVSI